MLKNNVVKKAVFLAVFLFLSPSGSTTEKAHGGQRIVSLKPNITEILFSLGLGEEVVGVTTYCNYPKEAKKIDKVADYVHVDVEKIITLHPTVVLGSEENSQKKEIEFLKSRGIDVKVYPFYNLAVTKASIVGMADYFGISGKGHLIVEEMNEALGRLKGRGEKNGGKKVLVIVGVKPFVVAGGNNIINDLLLIMGAENLAGKSRLKYPVYGLEQLISASPDIIVDISMGSEEGKKGESLELYRRFSSIPAVKNNRIYFLNMDDFHASPRIVGGAEKLARLL